MAEDHLMVGIFSITLETPYARWSRPWQPSGRGLCFAGCLIWIVEGLILEACEGALPTSGRLARELAIKRRHCGRLVLARDGAFRNDVSAARGGRERNDVGIGWHCLVVVPDIEVHMDALRRKRITNHV